MINGSLAAQKKDFLCGIQLINNLASSLKNININIETLKKM